MIYRCASVVPFVSLHIDTRWINVWLFLFGNLFFFFNPRGGGGWFYIHNWYCAILLVDWLQLSSHYLLQIFLSTRWAILLNLHVEMFRVNKYPVYVTIIFDILTTVEKSIWYLEWLHFPCLIVKLIHVLHVLVNILEL